MGSVVLVLLQYKIWSGLIQGVFPAQYSQRQTLDPQWPSRWKNVTVSLTHCVSLRLRSHFAYVGYYGLKCGWESVLFCRKKKNTRFLLSESGKCWDSRLITCFPRFLFNAGLHIEFDKSGSFYQFITRHCGYRLGHISVLRDQICGLGSTCKGKCLRYYTVSLVNFLWSNESVTWCNMRVVKAVLYCAESLQFSNGGGECITKQNCSEIFHNGGQCNLKNKCEFLSLWD